MKRILFINGPNLNMLGVREPDIYGTQTLNEIIEKAKAGAAEMGFEIEPYQSNHEGALIDFIQDNYQNSDGIIINPGALTHYGYSLRDCLAATGLTIIEVHISDIQKREEWRKKSVVSDICAEVISGLGSEGYFKALEFFRD
ncbi:MAG: type II 3-dehydroquinate dehydratase [candidate division Zixibacteria bacterium]